MKYQNKSFSSGANSKKYRDGWEQTFGNEAARKELRERGYSEESIDKVMRGLEQAKNGETKFLGKFEEFANNCESLNPEYAKVVDEEFWNLIDHCEDCHNHLSECGCEEEEETEIERANRLQDLGDQLFYAGKYEKTPEEKAAENKKRWEEYLETDDLDAYIDERSKKSPGFPVMVSEALRRRKHKKNCGLGFVDARYMLWAETTNESKKLYSWVILKIRKLYKWLKT